ncbi:MAG: hypothetical protein NTY38_31730 [Acidobacteria bacterium]|nr:hypothetical protein [Acidobacteriota bacterium]
MDYVWKIGPMVQPLITGESGYAAVVAFSERVDWLQECTRDSEAITRALHRVKPSEEPKTGRMLDAAMEAIERLRKRTTDRRVLLLISESRDRGSGTDLNTVALAAESAGVTVYAATYSAMKTAFTTTASAIGKPQAPKVYKSPSERSHTRNGQVPDKYNPPTPPPEQRADLLAAFTGGARGRIPPGGSSNYQKRRISPPHQARLLVDGAAMRDRSGASPAPNPARNGSRNR